MDFEFPDDLNRASNLILIFTTFILCITYNISLSYPIKLFLNDAISNDFLKHFVFQNIMKDKTLPILGRGLRPEGAKNCGPFRDNFFNKRIATKLAESYGFPSGHSQSAGFFMTFIFVHFNKNPIILFISLVYSLYIPYTRVKLGCHTIEQTIFGYLFGILTYYLFEYIDNKFIKSNELNCLTTRNSNENKVNNKNLENKLNTKIKILDKQTYNELD